MTRRGRIWVIGLFLVLGGLVAALLAAPFLLDQERYRGILTSRAGQLLNRKVTTSSLRVHLLPSPAVTIRDLRIDDRAPWSEPFLEAEAVRVALKLLPLLKGELQVGNVRIDRPRIRVARGADGWNIDDLMRPTVREVVVESHRTEGTLAARAQPALPGIAVAGLTIYHGDLIIENPLHPSGPASVQLKDVDLDIPTPLPPHPLRLHASGHLPGKLSGSFDLTGSIARYDGDHPAVDIALQAKDLDAAQLMSLLGLSQSSSAEAFSGTFDLDGKAVGEWPVLELQAEADLRRVGMALPRVNQGVTDPKENGKAPGDKAWLRAKGRWETDTLDLPDVSLLWTGQTTTGRLHLTTQPLPRLQFWLNTPDLSLDPILLAMTTADNAAPPPSRGQISRPSTSPSSPSPLRARGPGGGDSSLQVEGHLRSGIMRWGKLVVSDAEGDLRYCCKQLTIHQLRGGFYGGHLSGDVALSFNGHTPRLKVTTHLEGVQTEPLLGAFHTPQWGVRGVMTADSTLEFSGPIESGALARVSGQTEMVVMNGRVTGYTPLEKLSKTADPILKGLGLPSPNLNEFDRLSAHWTLDGGILRTRDLTMLRDGAKFYAAGSLNLLNQTMDFDVTAKVARTTLEAKVQGPSSDPVVTPQAGSIEGRVKTEVSKLLGNDRTKELGKALKQLFSR